MISRKMWRLSARIFFRTLSAVRSSPPHHAWPPLHHPITPPALYPLSSAARSYSRPLRSRTEDDDDEEEEEEEEERRDDGEMTCAEAKRLMRLVNVEGLKRMLGSECGEVIGYSDLLNACLDNGVSRSREEASAFARSLDDAGVVLLFRDKVYLHPDKVVELVRRAVPLALAPDDDPQREELKNLQKRKEEIDMLAHRQVRRILWGGLGFLVVQVGLFFRLTFWDFSWDVMEPITFFTTTTGLVIGYAYFLFTSRDPTYRDFMKRLFLSRQRKFFKKQNFDIERYMELQKKCRSPLDDNKAVGLDVYHKD
ncbi:hypothetical protein QJS04_geneDACA016932 [Acorus gramineus]|uniref:Calcium uniporter protein C-terminal domain-containing protein n=1 Tax=Acorus gramineus TaxID=55184 RepID=A0AAV9AJT0_ACOGR|nr:hypothetical protein QJS04_geneDACA016932 [Acorus gramineus]